MVAPPSSTPEGPPVGVDGRPKPNENSASPLKSVPEVRRDRLEVPSEGCPALTQTQQTDDLLDGLPEADSDPPLLDARMPCTRVARWWLLGPMRNSDVERLLCTEPFVSLPAPPLAGWALAHTVRW